MLFLDNGDPKATTAKVTSPSAQMPALQKQRQMRRWQYIKPQTASCCLMRASTEDNAFAKASRWDSEAPGLMKTVWVIPANYNRLQRSTPHGSTGSFWEDTGTILAWTTIALALTHPTLSTRGRMRRRGATRKSTLTRCPHCSGTSYTLHHAKGFRCRLQVC